MFSFSFAAFSCTVGPLPAQRLEIRKKLPINAPWIYISCRKTQKVNLCSPVTVLLGFTGLLLKTKSTNGILKWMVSDFYLC